MLIRNAVVDGRPTDLRLMHGAVQEMGMGLVKGLYESELDAGGDALTAWQGEELPRVRRRWCCPAASPRIVPGTSAPLLRWHDGRVIGVIDEHTAD